MFEETGGDLGRECCLRKRGGLQRENKVFASPENLTEIYLSFMHGTVSGDLKVILFFIFFAPFFLPKLNSHNKESFQKKKN